MKELSQEMLLKELEAMAIRSELYLRGKRYRRKWDEIKNSEFFKRSIRAFHQIKSLILQKPISVDEAKMEEFLQRRTIALIEAFHESNILHTLKETLAEYDTLKEVPMRKSKVSMSIIKAIMKDIEKGHVDETYLCVVFEEAGVEVKK